MYDNIHDADMRLRDTVVRYKGEPVIVRGVYIMDDGVVGAEVSNMSTGVLALVSLYDPYFNIASPPLGYVASSMNYGDSFVYAVRLPERKQQQGLSLKRLSFYECGAAPRNVRPPVGTRSLYTCIKGLYNSKDDYEDSHYKVDSRVVFAFSREIAVSSSRLYYRAHEIGSISHRGSVHIVSLSSPSFRYYRIQEVLRDKNWRFDWT